MKYGLLYHYWSDGWSCDYPKTAEKIKKAGFDVMEIGGDHLSRMNAAGGRGPWPRAVRQYRSGTRPGPCFRRQSHAGAWDRLPHGRAEADGRHRLQDDDRRAVYLLAGGFQRRKRQGTCVGPFPRFPSGTRPGRGGSWLHLFPRDPEPL